LIIGSIRAIRAAEWVSTSKSEERREEREEDERMRRTDEREKKRGKRAPTQSQSQILCTVRSDLPVILSGFSQSSIFFFISQ